MAARTEQNGEDGGPAAGEDGSAMKRGGSSWLRIVIAVLVVENAWLVFPRVRDVFLQVEESEEARGRRLAGELGCFNCHGPGGRGGVPNPGSEEETVPSFHEGTPMMYVHGDEDIREYILDGAPARKRARESYREAMAAQAVRMPAYRGWVSGRDVEALVRYVRSVSGLLRPSDPTVLRGAALVRQGGCFSCHGDMGSGGLPNPGSLKGYVPGFLGEDFRELVRDDEELLAWIRDGKIPRISEHPLGAFFFERQRIQMPAYGKLVPEADLQAMAAYVRWLAEGSWRTQPLSSQ